MNRKLIKDILPPFVIRFITGFFYGWHGNYKNWDQAKKRCSGYDSDNILAKVRNSALKVKSGEVLFERDSVTFNKPEYDTGVLSSILYMAGRNNGRLNLIDFGGSLGSTYYQYKALLDELGSVNWFIVEQRGFVLAGNNEFTTENLKFYYSIDDCLAENEIDAIYLSFVLPYIKDPYGLLKDIIQKRFRYILLNRMPFFDKPDRITVQKVNPRIYEASYPCWLFNFGKFVDFMAEDYELVLSYDNSETSNLNCDFKGLLYRLKGKA